MPKSFLIRLLYTVCSLPWVFGFFFFLFWIQCFWAQPNGNGSGKGWSMDVDRVGGGGGKWGWIARPWGCQPGAATLAKAHYSLSHLARLCPQAARPPASLWIIHTPSREPSLTQIAESTSQTTVQLLRVQMPWGGQVRSASLRSEPESAGTFLTGLTGVSSAGQNAGHIGARAALHILGKGSALCQG